jgi:3-hydroxyisobutyrate dehydrogenase-like beta-hydroxyacid dehydrogenase
VRVGLLHPGQMGAAVGSAVNGDVLWASDGRSEATALRAGAAGFTDAGSIDELVRSSDVIISICPPAAAEEVAGDVFDAGFDRLFVEANAISPARIRRIAELGPNVVDGSIIAASGINLYLAGDGADKVAALFPPEGDVKPVILPGKVGAASGLKMAFGGWNKIGIALTWQARAIARAYGVEPWLDLEGVTPDRLERVVDRAWRWGPEMDEIAEACEALGLPAGLPRAAADFYRGVEEKTD